MHAENHILMSVEHYLFACATTLLKHRVARRRVAAATHLREFCLVLLQRLQQLCLSLVTQL